MTSIVATAKSARLAVVAGRDQLTFFAPLQSIAPLLDLAGVVTCPKKHQSSSKVGGIFINTKEVSDLTSLASTYTF